MNVPLSLTESELIAELLEVVLPIAASHARGGQVRTLDEIRVMDSFRGWIARNLIEEKDLAAIIYRMRNSP